MVLWIVVAVLLGLTVFALLRPLLAGEAEAAGGTAGDVYARQLDEVESDRARGLIDDADAAAARTEIARRLLRAGNEAGRIASRGRRRWASALLIAFFVAVFSLGAYVFIGAPGLRDQPLAARLAPVDEERLADLLAQAEARLAENPGDGTGWAVVAPAYQRLGRFADAAEAFGRANALLGETAARLSGQAESLTFANRGTVTPEARRLFEAALERAPDAVAPAVFLAIADRQQGRFEDAAARWRALLRSSDGTEAWLQLANAELARLAEAAPEAVGAPALPGPDAETVAAAGEMSEEDRAAMIERMVTGLAERLRSDGGSVDEWVRLVRSYRALGRPDAAEAALADARAALPQSDLPRLEAAAGESR